jgi:hypothetical protein
MIGQMLGDRDVSTRVTGSVAGAIIAVQNGADIVRVHDVKETKDVRYAIAGVGIGPNKPTSTPADRKPASSADSNKYPEIRVSLPITTLGFLFFCAKTEPTAPQRVWLLVHHTIIFRTTELSFSLIRGLNLATKTKEPLRSA